MIVLFWRSSDDKRLGGRSIGAYFVTSRGDDEQAAAGLFSDVYRVGEMCCDIRDLLCLMIDFDVPRCPNLV